MHSQDLLPAPQTDKIRKWRVKRPNSRAEFTTCRTHVHIHRLPPNFNPSIEQHEELEFGIIIAPIYPMGATELITNVKPSANDIVTIRNDFTLRKPKGSTKDWSTYPPKHNGTQLKIMETGAASVTTPRCPKLVRQHRDFSPTGERAPTDRHSDGTTSNRLSGECRVRSLVLQFTSQLFRT